MDFVVWCKVMDIFLKLWDCFTLCIMSAILSVYEIDKHTFDCTLTCGFVIRHYLKSMSKYANVVLKYSVLTANQKHLAGPES